MTGQAWAWTHHTFEFDGQTFIEWRGESKYHLATVTNFPSTWQATMHLAGGNQHSPYYKTPESARKWCERYGQPRKTRTHARQETRS